MQAFSTAIIAAFLLFVLSLLINIGTLINYASIGTKEIGNVPFKRYGREAKLFVGNLILTVTLFVLALISKYTFTQMIKKDIAQFVRDYNRGNGHVFVNDKLAHNPNDIIEALNHIVDRSYNRRSSPETSLDIRVQNRHEQITINLYRDSQQADEYWVFFNQYKLTRDNELGKIKTDALDGY